MLINNESGCLYNIKYTYYNSNNKTSIKTKCSISNLTINILAILNLNYASTINITLS